MSELLRGDVYKSRTQDLHTVCIFFCHMWSSSNLTNMSALTTSTLSNNVLLDSPSCEFTMTIYHNGPPALLPLTLCDKRKTRQHCPKVDSQGGAICAQEKAILHWIWQTAPNSDLITLAWSRLVKFSVTTIQSRGTGSLRPYQLPSGDTLIGKVGLRHFYGGCHIQEVRDGVTDT